MKSDEQFTIYEFDEFRLDSQNLTLWHRGKLAPLPPKAVELLLVFIERPGLIVSKDDLLDAVWGDTFVEESNLSHNIYLLRKTFKSASGPNYIETVPRRGYKFNATVSGIIEHQEITIERRYFTQTVIEETAGGFVEDIGFDEAIDIAAKHTLPPPSRVWWGRLINTRSVLIGMIGVAVVSISIFGSVFWHPDERGSSTGFKDIRSIAVIPFDFHGGEDETISIRITDALVTGLHSNSDMNVRPVSSVMAYIRDKRDPIEIGKDLLVDAVIDGRLQQEGDRLRLNIQLISVRTGDTLWTGQFDGKADKLLTLQDDFTSRFFSENGLTVPKAGGKRRDGDLTTNSEAYEQYLNGRYFFARRNGPDLLRAEQHFKKAITLDDKFAEALVGLANILAFRQNESKEAAELATRAIKLAPEMAESYATQAFIMSFHDWDWQNSEAEFLKAVYLDPRDSLVRQWYANNLMLQGRFVEAEAQFLRALELDPTSAAITTDLAQLYYFQRRYERSMEISQKALELQSDAITATSFYNHALFQHWKEIKQHDPTAEKPASLSKLEEALNKQMKLEFPSEEAKDMNYGTYLYGKLNFHRWYQNKDETLAVMEKMLEMKHFMLPFAIRDPLLDFVRDDSRFVQISEKVNLK